MKIARRHVAARNVLAALVVTIGVRPAPVYAGEGGPQLVLPLVAALAVASAVRGLPAGESGGRLDRLRRPSALPQQLQIPDVYANRERDFIDPTRSNPLVDEDRYVWIDLLRRKRLGWMASVAFDTETRGPVPGTSRKLSLVFEYEF